jgi:hypothetical protein
MISLLSLLLACGAPEPLDGPTLEGPDGAAPPPRQLRLSAPNLIAGEVATLTVTGAPPGAEVLLAHSRGGIGAGPCPPALDGQCSELARPVRLATLSLVADHTGTASVDLQIPTARAGSYLAIQAFSLTPDVLVSNPVGRPIGAPGAATSTSTDDDGDGLSEDQGDCADHDAAFAPGLLDPRPDHIDQDCDDADGNDDDADGWPAGPDCDDGAARVHPGALEACNGIDDDCDGPPDEDCIAASCFDGLRNGDEQNIDCGGACPACPVMSCGDVLASGIGTTDGYYAIDGDGLGPEAPRAVWCDMTTDGGGWTLLARASETNGAGGDYEFSDAMGPHSVFTVGFDGGTPEDPQYLMALDAALGDRSGSVDIQYTCYDSRSPDTTRYWVKALDIPAADLLAAASAPNPDWLRSATTLVNADGYESAAGYFAIFGREYDGSATCGNSFAGQSGMKYSCAHSAQTGLAQRSVWLLTHYGTELYSEVSSCGPAVGSVLPYYVGEVRWRPHQNDCGDGLRTGDETGVDCGGSCGACAGASCALPVDCASGRCVGDLCAAPTCADGVANGDETDVDCGGACAPCAALATCEVHADCASAWCEAGQCAAPSCTSCYPSCEAIRDAGASRGDGVYTIDPDGAGPGAPLAVQCDMSTDGGGWTVVARASDTNGVGGDYELRAAFGAHSLLGRSFSGGRPIDAQYTQGLDALLPPGDTSIELAYVCYPSTSPYLGRYWVRMNALDTATLLSSLTPSNPDFLYTNVQVTNKDGVSSSTANFAFFGREEVGTASCSNGFAGQSGVKYACNAGGQAPLSPRSVWMLTHYGSNNYTEVTSCGSVGGSVLPYYVGEVRYR